tara:strand:+ start:1831 stop:3135 length:1305 start_codon:yes stop_codon:yes gene_type:complete
MIGLLLLFITGVVSLHIGKVFLEQQHETIENTAHAQKEHIDRNLGFVHGHIGLLLYYIRFGLANEAPALAGLSIGHRDIRPPAQLVNIRNLEEQKNTSELVNPYYQLLGNMDFSFVLIYLFPLIIIAICFNLFSEEKESGTWQLVSSQSQKPFRIIRAKILIRLVSVLLVLLLLFLIATVYLSIPLDKVYGAFVLSSILYILFWFVAVWFVINLDKSSNENALILLSSWINLTIVIPAALNNVVENLYPIPEAYETTIDGRDGYHNKWDQPKEPTILKFKEHYPQFSKYEHPEDQSFGWFWYYAIQQMGDDEATEARQAMKDKLYARNRFTKLIGYVLPSVHTQLSLNSLGKSDMSNYLNYMDALEQFHEDKRLMFYPMIFENVAISSEKWNEHKLEYFEDKRETEWIYLLLPILIWSGLLLWLSRTKMKEQLK